METRGGLRLTPITDYSSPACHAPSCPLKPQTTGGYFRIPITSVFCDTLICDTFVTLLSFHSCSKWLFVDLFQCRSSNQLQVGWRQAGKGSSKNLPVFAELTVSGRLHHQSHTEITNTTLKNIFKQSFNSVISTL